MSTTWQPPDLRTTVALDAAESRLAVGDLAATYGFTDLDGRQPSAFKRKGRMTLANRMERLNRVVAQAGART